MFIASLTRKVLQSIILYLLVVLTNVECLHARFAEKLQKYIRYFLFKMIFSDWLIPEQFLESRRCCRILPWFWFITNLQGSPNFLTLFEYWCVHNYSGNKHIHNIFTYTIYISLNTEYKTMELANQQQEMQIQCTNKFRWWRWKFRTAKAKIKKVRSTAKSFLKFENA